RSRLNTLYTRLPLKKKLYSERFMPPDPFSSFEQHQRFYHEDLAGKSFLDLRIEEIRILQILDKPQPRRWFFERLDKINAAMERSHG
ncbi:MAG TPA: hypothetical protein VN944_04475, partial [Nitrospiria bacterium]|nr:hypothetical protein [Nitrospiria bacterium]